MAASTNSGHSVELAELKRQPGDITKLLANLVDAQRQSNELLTKLGQRHDTMSNNQPSSHLLLDAQKQTNALLLKLVEHQDKVAQGAMPSRPLFDAGIRLTGPFELLEQILQLDRTQIIWLQGVNRQFRMTIQNSLPLQRALFLAPAPIPTDPRRPPK